MVNKTIAVIPAHNEERLIAASVANAAGQVDKVIVVDDRSSDETASRASDAGAQVITLFDNDGRRAGAVNAGLEWVRDNESVHYILIMDADCFLRAGFVSSAVDILERNEDIGAVGGVIEGDDSGGLVGLLQKMEYHRFARYLRRRGGRSWNLPGGATVFRPQCLKDGYQQSALAEDHELTLRIRHEGWRIVGADECRFYTENMATWRSLWKQRLRWQRGGVDNLLEYGLTPITRPYWRGELARGFAVLLQTLILTLIAWSIASSYSLRPSWWLTLTLLFVFERAWTVRELGKKPMLIASLYIPEIIYGWLHCAAWVTGMWKSITHSQEEWVMVRKT